MRQLDPGGYCNLNQVNSNGSCCPRGNLFYFLNFYKKWVFGSWHLVESYWSPKWCSASQTENTRFFFFCKRSSIPLFTCLRDYINATILCCNLVFGNLDDLTLPAGLHTGSLHWCYHIYSILRTGCSKFSNCFVKTYSSQNLINWWCCPISEISGVLLAWACWNLPSSVKFYTLYPCHYKRRHNAWRSH